MKIQRSSAGGFIQNNKGEFLLVKRSKDDDFLPDLWELPGGGIDFGEEPQKGLQREIKEECGLDVEVSFPLCVHTYPMIKDANEIQRIEITFLCKLKDVNQSVVLSFEHSDYKWIAEREVHAFELSDYMRRVVNDSLRNPLIRR